MQIKIILVIISLLISGCIGTKPNKINNVGYEIPNEIKRDCQVLNEQCWNSMDNLIAGNITMQGQVLSISNGEINVNLTSIFNMTLPNIPTVLFGVDNNTDSNILNKIKAGKTITFTTTIKPLNPTRDLIKYAIITRIFPNNQVIEAQKYIRTIQKISKIELLIRLYDVKVESVR